MILSLLKDPKWTQGLNLQEFCDHLIETQQSNVNNLKIVLEFIAKELFQPFLEMRPEFPTKQKKEEIFYYLTNEVSSHLKEEMLLTVRIISIDEVALKVVALNKIIGQIPRQLCDIESHQDLRVVFKPGEYFTARLKAIMYEKLRLRLSLTKEDLANHQNYLLRNQILAQYSLQNELNFKIIKAEDFPSQTADAKPKATFVPRKITHPYFKNVSCQAAIEVLSRKEVGDFLFRPSSRGNSFIALTWMINSNQTFIHLFIKEGLKNGSDELSNMLYLENLVYESFDDIIARYIQPINKLIAKLKEHKKVSKGTYEDVKKLLNDMYESNPDTIPYTFFFSPKQPACLILSYIVEKNRIRSEAIGIKPNGLSFHQQIFPSLQALIEFYKSKFKGEEYQQYLEKVGPLQLDNEETEPATREEQGNRRRERPREEGRRPREDDKYRRPNRYMDENDNKR